MKSVIGGYQEASGDPCKQYQGQTTWQCGSNRNGNNCTVDICFCDGRPPACNQYAPCSEI